jgi:hypothetical protein
MFGPSGAPADLAAVAEPDHFQDLNLDQVVADGQLAPYFHYPLRDPELVRFRHGVFLDLEGAEIREIAERFTAAMDRMRRRLELLAGTRHAPQKHRWFLDIVLAHGEAVTALADGLRTVTSPGLRAACDDLAEYTRSPRFRLPHQHASRLRDQLGQVRYDMLLRGDKITVARRDTEGEADYGARVLATFERFRRLTPQDYRKDLSADLGLDRVEAGVLDLVVQLYPGLFAELATFHADHQDFVSEDIVRLDRELRFYLGYLSFLAPLRAAGLPTCYPAVSGTVKELVAREVFDIALAAKLGGSVVVNDLHLTGAERILVVSGPNQGGKTTLSRTFGQLHYLAALGCPVPGREVRVYLPDRIFTHYTREENPSALAGKLEDELRRMHAILRQATPDSVIILNEIFSSTTLQDARVLSREILGAITDLDAQCLWVSFIDELSRMNAKTVSMVSTMTGDSRTYRLVRQPADGRAYARAIAEKHGLTYAQLTNRVRG